MKAKPDTATAKDASTAVAMLSAAAIWPPFRARKGEEPECVREDVVRLWVLACGRSGVSGQQLIDATQAYLDRSADPSWPSPGEVIGLVVRHQATQAAGCGRCNENGLAMVAVHYEDHVRLVMAHCTCQRGHTMADRRGQSADGKSERPRGLLVTEYAEAMNRKPGVVRVFTFPSEAEKRLDLTERKLSPEADERLRAYLASLAEDARDEARVPPVEDDWRW